MKKSIGVYILWGYLIFLLVLFECGWALTSLRVDELKAENAALKSEITELQKDNASLERVRAKTESENAELRQDVNYLIEILTEGK